MGIICKNKKDKLGVDGKNILLNRDVNPTKGATDLYKAINSHNKTMGRHTYNLGQGAEAVCFDLLNNALLEEKANNPRGINSAYPADAGGGDANAVMSAFLKRYFGVPDTKDNTVVSLSQGRAPLGSAARLCEGGTFAHEHRWTVVDNLFTKNTPFIEYKNPDHGTEFNRKEFDNLLTDDIDNFYLNPQHNPTGRIFEREWMVGFKQWLDDKNEDRKARGLPLIKLILDVPYFHAQEINLDANPANDEFFYDKCGLNILMDDEGITPYSAMFSFSKAFGTADPGFTVTRAHPAILNQIKNDMLSNGHLTGGVRELIPAACKTFTKENDPKIIAHLNSLYTKYIKNNAILKEAISHLEGVEIVDGDAGMTALLSLDLEQFYGKTLEGKITGEYEINDMNDIVEYLAINYGVVTVNNGEKNGKGFLRLANALDNESYGQSMTKLGAGLTEIASFDFKLAHYNNIQTNHLPQMPQAGDNHPILDQ